MSYRICLLPGDGIGPEVIAEAQKVLEALDLQIEFQQGDIGFSAYKKHGTPLPESTLEAILKSDATLFGAVTRWPKTGRAPIHPGFIPPCLGTAGLLGGL